MNKIDYFMEWFMVGIMRFCTVAMLGCYVDQGIYHRLPYGCWDKCIMLIFAALAWAMGNYQESKIVERRKAASDESR